MTPDWSEWSDPVPYADLDDPQTLNLYAYVRNNPLSNTDDDGHDRCNGADGGGPDECQNNGGSWIPGNVPRAPQQTTNSPQGGNLNWDQMGVRYTPFEDTEFLIEHTEKLSYVKADPSRHIEIYFSESRAVEAKLSCDQEFLYDAVFRSDDGDYAIGFGTEELSEANLHSLEKTEAEWAVAHPLE